VRRFNGVSSSCQNACAVVSFSAQFNHGLGSVLSFSSLFCCGESGREARCLFNIFTLNTFVTEGGEDGTTEEIFDLLRRVFCVHFRMKSCLAAIPSNEKRVVSGASSASKSLSHKDAQIRGSTSPINSDNLFRSSSRWALKLSSDKF